MKKIASYLKEAKLSDDQLYLLFKKPAEYAKTNAEKEYLLSWLPDRSKELVNLFPKSALKNIQIRPYDVAETQNYKNPQTPYGKYVPSGYYPASKGRDYTIYYVPKRTMSGVPTSVRQWVIDVIKSNYPALEKKYPKSFKGFMIDWMEFILSNKTEDGKLKVIRIPLELLLQKKNAQIRKEVTRVWPEDPDVKELVKQFK